MESLISIFPVNITYYLTIFCILPAIRGFTVSDRRAVYNVSLPLGRGKPDADKSRGVGKQVLFAGIHYGQSLTLQYRFSLFCIRCKGYLGQHAGQHEVEPQREQFWVLG